MRKKFPAIVMTVAMMLFCASSLTAENSKTSVTQVTTQVTVSEDVDYVVSSATPFTAEGLVNITNIEHAVLILEKVKPLKIAQWLKYIQINGDKAVNGTNCQVKLYNLGCIVLPYAGGDNFRPLTVYSEKNFEGESCNDFGLEHTDGYMNTLTDAKLNNRISSFKLKRGYMVTFALKAEGRGYSRCFIAADKDIEMASLPGILDNSISSYRVFKWYDVGKKNLASDVRTDALAALNVQSCYDWGEGNSSLLPDYEWVSNHIYEDWPSSRAIGRASQSPHSKTNNEPFNSSDDHPQSLDEILNNWENMMRTGKRLCSPASHDGALDKHHAFLDSIDARGWRCDIIDLHCYWPEWNFYNQIKGPWVDRHHRPVWISEWVWGSSWGNQGIFQEASSRDNPTAADYQKNKEALTRICNALNSYDYIERYYYWNSEANCSKIYRDGKLTPAGEMYASMDAGVGYNGKYDYAPKTPKQYDPSDLTIEYDNNTKVAKLQWYERNGEMNASMVVQRRSGTGKAWETIANITLQDDAATYTYEDTEATNGCQYQVVIKDANNKERKTATVMAASATLKAGDELDIDGTTKYLGGNIMLNGSFEMGLYGWTNGKGEPLSAPYFQVVSAGGNDGGTYLQAYGSGVLATEKAVNTSFAIKANTDYYFSVASCNMPSGYTCRLGISEEGKTSTSPKVYVNNATSNWLTQYGTFNSGEWTQARVHFYELAAKAQVDQLLLCELFDTQDAAIADGVEKARLKAEAFIAYNTRFANLNDDLTATLATINSTDQVALDELESIVEGAIKAYDYLADGTLIPYAEKLASWKLYGIEEFEPLLLAAKEANTIKEIVTNYTALETALSGYLPYTVTTENIKSPSFAKATDWVTKNGTYKDGDQRVATQDGVTCWNAWWSGIDANDETSTMSILQNKIKIATHGLYALECKASTEHYCLSDQHGFITDGTTTENTQTLKADYLDLNMPVADRWDVLYSAPIYMEDNSTVSIGFEGSKKGSLSDAWIAIGNTSTSNKNDKREGWWCATDFAFRYTPLYLRTVVPNEFGTICLPFAVRPSATMKFYRIAGINPDYNTLYLSEIEEVAAGVPCIFRSTDEVARFLEYGDAVKSPVAGEGNLRGFLVSGKVANNYYYVKNGAFEKVTGDRPNREAYTANMRPFTDNVSKIIPVIDEWEGESMPIIGVTEEEIIKNNGQTGISMLIQMPQIDGLYSLDGRSVKAEGLKPGLYIKVVNGRSYKTIIK